MRSERKKQKCNSSVRPSFVVVRHNEEDKTKLEGVKCPKQSEVVECGYYMMRFMLDIILSKSISIIDIMKDSRRTYTQNDIDCIRSKWAEFVGKHVLEESIGVVKSYFRQLIDL
uniref:Ubiquitin-like protease family profile domain-containing protein n=1 Tax=Cucumis melo TaxID=3656 RepID=A0A9I9EG58_CUCME